MNVGEQADELTNQTTSIVTLVRSLSEDCPHVTEWAAEV
jgi:hypothetical protein